MKSSALFAICLLTLFAGVMFADEFSLTRLEDLDLSNMVQGWGSPGINKSVLGNPLTINGKIYEHGVGTHAVSRLTVDLHGIAVAFQAQVGIDDQVLEKKMSGSATFLVFVDQKKVFDSGVLKAGQAPVSVDVDLRGAKRLDLEVHDGGDTNDYDHADWADAKILTLRKASSIHGLFQAETGSGNFGLLHLPMLLASMFLEFSGREPTAILCTIFRSQGINR